MKRYVLDASALMAFFEGRTGADDVEKLLRKAAETRHFLLMSVINWGEIYYSIWRAHGEEVANERIKQVAQLPIEVADVDMPTTKLAATLKARHKLPYADCFAAALTQQKKATLVTTDKDFAQVEKELQILWASSS